MMKRLAVGIVVVAAFPVLVAMGCGGTKNCVATPCATKADCPQGSLDCVAGKCVTCKVDTDCTTGAKKCNTTTGTCATCATDADCTVAGTKIETGKCDTGSGQCIKCAAAADCTFTGSIYKACSSGSVCVQCAANSDCSGGAFSACNTTTGTCSNCGTDAECVAVLGAGSTCGSGKCSCTSDTMCQAGGAKATCQ